MYDDENLIKYYFTYLYIFCCLGAIKFYKMDNEQVKKSLPSTMSLCATVVTHILLLAPVIYIVILYSQNYSFFSWHPILMSIGVSHILAVLTQQQKIEKKKLTSFFFSFFYQFTCTVFFLILSRIITRS